VLPTYLTVKCRLLASQSDVERARSLLGVGIQALETVMAQTVNDAIHGCLFDLHDHLEVTYQKLSQVSKGLEPAELLKLRPGIDRPAVQPPAPRRAPADRSANCGE
jgi:hypothetical protein